MEDSDLVLLKEILSIPTYFGREERIREYLIEYCNKSKLSYFIDEIGNLYITKGKVEEGSFYPCVTAHLDSVHESHLVLINENLRKDIIQENNFLYAQSPLTSGRVGLGGDDLVGVFLCLKMLEVFDTLKCAFFVKEEFGCCGSKLSDDEFFSDIGYCIAFDGPTNNWYTETLRGKRIYSLEFYSKVSDTLKIHNITNFSKDPYTDITMITEKYNICCCNLPASYFKWHTNKEYVDISYMDNCISLGVDHIKILGNKKYILDK